MRSWARNFALIVPLLTYSNDPRGYHPILWESRKNSSRFMLLKPVAIRLESRSFTNFPYVTFNSEVTSSIYTFLILSDIDRLSVSSLPLPDLSLLPSSLYKLIVNSKNSLQCYFLIFFFRLAAWYLVYIC